MTEVVKIYLKKDMMNYVVMLLDTIDINKTFTVKKLTNSIELIYNLISQENNDKIPSEIKSLKPRISHKLNNAFCYKLPSKNEIINLGNDRTRNNNNNIDNNKSNNEYNNGIRNGNDNSNDSDNESSDSEAYNFEEIDIDDLNIMFENLEIEYYGSMIVDKIFSYDEWYKFSYSRHGWEIISAYDLAKEIWD
ncbi:hypothetical protein H8356DRAFT_1321419 [Neocallimastix lanati (nom. inval.)]|nr:hypothetical protein H8356DRAFT_1321419 [Neocallimastix sp. JGI-2020a]